MRIYILRNESVYFRLHSVMQPLPDLISISKAQTKHAGKTVGNHKNVVQLKNSHWNMSATMLTYESLVIKPGMYVCIFAFGQRYYLKTKGNQTHNFCARHRFDFQGDDFSPHTSIVTFISLKESMLFLCKRQTHLILILRK